MNGSSSTGLWDEELHLAGERVPAGLYREISTGNEIRFETEDHLPATHNGQVGAYACVRDTWGQRQTAQRPVCSSTVCDPPAVSGFSAKRQHAVRLFLLSAHAPWCEDAHKMLESSEFEIVAKTPSCSQGLRTAFSTPPDIVLLDSRLSGERWNATLCEVRETCPRVPVVLLAPQVDTKLMVCAFSEGASGCLPLGIQRAKLLYALRVIVSGASIVILSSPTGGEEAAVPDRAVTL